MRLFFVLVVVLTISSFPRWMICCLFQQFSTAPQEFFTVGAVNPNMRDSKKVLQTHNQFGNTIIQDSISFCPWSQKVSYGE